MNKIFENPSFPLNEMLSQTLQKENQEIDDLINILTKNMKIKIETFKRQLKTHLINQRKLEFQKLILPIEKTHIDNDFIIKRMHDFFETYQQIKPDLDIFLPSFSFNQIKIKKEEFLKKFEVLLSQFSAENFLTSFETTTKKLKNISECSLSNLDKIYKANINKSHNSFLKSITFLPYKPDNNLFQESNNNLLKILVTCDLESNLKFRNWFSRNCYEEISNSHQKPINILKTIKDQNKENKYYVLSGGDDGEVKFWDATSNCYSCIFSFQNHDDVNHIEIIPNFKRPLRQNYIVTVGNKSQIKVWSWTLSKSTVVKRIQIQDLSFVSCVKSLFLERYVFNKYIASSLIITGLENGKILVWNWEKKNPLMLNILDNDFSAVRSLLCIKQFYKSYQSFIKINNFYFLFVAGYLNGSIKFYDIKGKLIKGIYGAHEGEVAALESLPISSNENICKEYTEILISGGNDKFIRFWKWRSGQILKILSCDHKIMGYNSLKVENVFDLEENKEKIILVSGGRKGNDFCQVSIWKY